MKRGVCHLAEQYDTPLSTADIGQLLWKHVVAFVLGLFCSAPALRPYYALYFVLSELIGLTSHSTHHRSLGDDFMGQMTQPTVKDNVVNHQGPILPGSAR